MSAENEPILPPSVLRNIGDKMYEKRKQAALEVEQVRALASLSTADALPTTVLNSGPG